MNIKLGRIPYLNSEVFYQDFPMDLVELVEAVPRELSRAARRGDVDVGPVPVVTCFELEDQFMPLGNYGIAVKDKARSVLLFSKRPVEELTGARVAVTGESSTSVRLMKTLLHRCHGVRPAQYTSTQELNTDAVLLIGDAALNNRKGLPSYRLVYDLGEMWREWTGLPFVFAQWIVRRDLNPEAIAFLLRLIEQSLEVGMSRIDDIAARRTDLSMTAAEVREYLLGFNYAFGPEEQKAMTLFRKYLDEEDRDADGEAGGIEGAGKTRVINAGEARAVEKAGTDVREAPNAG